MAKSATTTRVTSKLKDLGERPNDGFLRSANLIFFGLALFFCLIYFVASVMDEVVSDGAHAKEETNTNIIVISIMCLILFSLEFYSDLGGSLRIIRLAAVATLVAFAGLSVPALLNEAETTSGTSHGDQMVHILGAVAVGFAGIAAILNGLEIFRNITR